jgi:hypothetical protein
MIQDARSHEIKTILLVSIFQNIQSSSGSIRHICHNMYSTFAWKLQELKILHLRHICLFYKIA